MGKKVHRMNLRPYLSRTFFWPQYDFIQKSLLTSEKKHDSQLYVFIFLGFIFSMSFYSWDLISWDFIGSSSPHAILRKKVPRNQKQRTLFAVTFSKDLIKFKLYFLVFFSWNFFPRDFLTQIQWSKLQNVQGYKSSKVTTFFILYILSLCSVDLV